MVFYLLCFLILYSPSGYFCKKTQQFGSLAGCFWIWQGGVFLPGGGFLGITGEEVVSWHQNYPRKSVFSFQQNYTVLVCWVKTNEFFPLKTHLAFTPRRYTNEILDVTKPFNRYIFGVLTPHKIWNAQVRWTV